MEHMEAKMQSLYDSYDKAVQDELRERDEVIRKMREALESCGGERGYDGGLYQTYCNVRVEEALALSEPYVGASHD